MKKERGDASNIESARATWFCCTFKLVLFQLMCKALSRIFKKIKK